MRVRSNQNKSVNGFLHYSPVQQFPVLSSPAVFKLLRVHAADFVEVRLIDSEQAKAIHLPVSCKNKEMDQLLNMCNFFT